MQKCKVGWLGDKVVGWVAGWLIGWLGGWVARAPPPPITTSTP